MATDTGRRSHDVEACVDAVIDRVGKTITLGLPLGLGKPIRFVNALYQRAKVDPEIQLHIVTALSLLAPRGGSSLEKRFLTPLPTGSTAGFRNWRTPGTSPPIVSPIMCRSPSSSLKPATISTINRNSGITSAAITPMRFGI